MTHFLAAVASLGAAAVMVGCEFLPSGEPTAAVVSEEHVLEVGSTNDDGGPWFPTWEEAALAEARRLHPEAQGLLAERQRSRIGERVTVRDDAGRCWLYGGESYGSDRWRANEIGPC